MPSLENALALRAARTPLTPGQARASLYAGPLATLAPFFGAGAPTVSILGACSSSTFALGIACRWLEALRADLVIAGGYDALSLFIATGFEALGTITTSEPRPFRLERDGMVLGEGAALLALTRSEDGPATLGTILGFGATSDAFHVTAPDPAGRGLARAAELALADAGVTPAEVDLVSAHATSTAHNDAAEVAVLESLFRKSASPPVLHAYKAAIGHSLGAAGALESLAGLAALEQGLLPATPGAGTLDPRLPVDLLERHRAGAARRCLKLSAAFGGANAALLLGKSGTRARGAARPERPVRLLALGRPVLEPDLALIAERTSLPELYRTRLDRASALALTAAATLVQAGTTFEPEGTAIVVGTTAASIEADEAFDARRRERGALAVEPRRFPATSPNLPAGQCSLALGLRGPALAVGGGPGAALDALSVALDLVALGDAERALVIACDDMGPVATELIGSAGLALPADGALAVLIGAGGPNDGPGLERESFEAWSARARDAVELQGGSGWRTLLVALPQA
jgi:3-oxoacyl-[acyl-carrier-protein] synthase-1/3-oxoacyl-[acyl-carrier-protein] synthase II